VASPLGKSRLALAAVVLLAAAGVAVWLMQPDPRLLEARRLQERIASAETRRLSAAEQLELRGQLYAALEHLSPSQQRLLQKDRRRLLLEQIERYNALPPAEQQTYLDEEIDRLRAIRAIRDERAKTAGERPTDKQNRRRTPAVGGGNGGGGNGGGAGGPAGTGSSDLEQALKKELDSSTPEQRALVSQYCKQIIDRWKAQGRLRADFPDDLNALLALMQ
jgi:hypothetical protein